MEKLNPLIIEKSGKKYTLEYNNRSIKEMESKGFRIDDEHLSAPVTFSDELIRGAFIAHHKAIPKNTIDEIIQSLIESRKLGIVRTKLVELYTNTLEMLYGGDEEENDDGFFILE